MSCLVLCFQYTVECWFFNLDSSSSRRWTLEESIDLQHPFFAVTNRMISISFLKIAIAYSRQKNLLCVDFCYFFCDSQGVFAAFKSQQHYHIRCIVQSLFTLTSMACSPFWRSSILHEFFIVFQTIPSMVSTVLAMVVWEVTSVGIRSKAKQSVSFVRFAVPSFLMYTIPSYLGLIPSTTSLPP